MHWSDRESDGVRGTPAWVNWGLPLDGVALFAAWDRGGRERVPCDSVRPLDDRFVAYFRRS
ncbi:hypothetical protein THIOKS11320074 [Thiocapsa sp. KS1]|nr:hypothetical protein THIOKS11320074 [Thiocapsa sp. KS1]